MALFAKAGRFQEDKGSGLGPGDYDPCLPKSTGLNAGACSLGFTAPKAAVSPKAALSPRKRDAIPEDQEQDSFPVQDKRPSGLTLSTHATVRSSNLPTVGLATSPTRQPSRLVHVELEQQAKQLAWSEREREKVQAEAAKLREREKALVKSETQARADSSKAMAVRDALVKRAETAERKVEAMNETAKLLGTAEAKVVKLSTEAAASECAAKETATTRTTLTKKNKELESIIHSLREKVLSLELQESSLAATLQESEKRETDLKQHLSNSRACDEALEEEMRAALAAAGRSAAAVEEMSRNAESLRSKLEVTETGMRTLEVLSNRLGMELEESNERLKASQGSNKAREVNIRELREEIEDSENRLLAASAEQMDMKRALSDLRQEVVTEREQRIALEECIGAREEDASSTVKEVHGLQAQLDAAAANVKILEASLEDSIANSDTIQRRLGDALAEGVEYADSAIRSEERLRNSEADCAALWGECEEAKNQLSAAVEQRKVVQERLQESAKEVERLRACLCKTELRLATTVGEGEELEDELAGLREECNSAKESLEGVREKYATMSSEARVLKSSLDDSRATVARLTTELDVANSRLAEAGAEEDCLSKQLAESEEKVDGLRIELEEAIAKVDTGATGYVEMEVKVGKTESICEKLKEALSSVEAQLVDAAAYGARTQDEHFEALAKSTSLQEELSEFRDKLSDMAERNQALEERLAQSDASSAKIAEAADLKEAERADAIDRLEMQLAESERARSTLQRTEDCWQKKIDEVIAERRLLENRLGKSQANSARATDSLVDTISHLEAEVASGELVRQELEVSQAEAAVLMEELRDANDQLAAAAADAVGVERKLAESEGECQRFEGRLHEAILEVTRLTERIAVKEADAKARRQSLANDIAKRGAKEERGKQLEKDVHKKDKVCAELRDMLKSSMEAVNAAAARTQVLEKGLKDSEVEAARLKIAVEIRDAKIDGATITVAEQAVKIDTANATVAEQAAKIADLEGQHVRILRAVDDIEASHESDNGTNVQLKKSLADIHGMGMELGDKLAVVILERMEALAKVEVANSALEASSAGMRTLERDLEISEARVKEAEEERNTCIKERDALLDECKRGAAVLLAKSEAQAQELVARLQLHEAKSAQEILVVKNQAEQSRAEACALSAELEELQGMAQEVHRAQTEEYRAVREAGFAQLQVQKLASENAVLAGQNSNKQRTKHMEDLKKQNMKLSSESASLVSELALATSVLEAIGLLPKEEAEDVTTPLGKVLEDDDSMETRSRGILSRMASGANSMSNSMSPPRRTLSCGVNFTSPQSDVRKHKILGRFGRRPSQEERKGNIRSPSERSRLALQDRLLNALGSPPRTVKESPTSTHRRCATDPNDAAAGGSLMSMVGMAGKASDGIIAGPPPALGTVAGMGTDTAGSTCLSLEDERVRAEVRKVLDAQTSNQVSVPLI